MELLVMTGGETTSRLYILKYLEASLWFGTPVASNAAVL
jgi:hypothetical protein